jgi:hypothetical protein
MYANRTTSERIEVLKPNEIFVFGSNEGGFHNGGAAKLALDKFGAIYGKSFGFQGQSFAIPTMDSEFNPLPLYDIQCYVNLFVDYAKCWNNSIFLVTSIGCGIAGFSPEEIAPMFKNCLNLKNVFLPELFWEILEK